MTMISDAFLPPYTDEVTHTLLAVSATRFFKG